MGQSFKYDVTVSFAGEDRPTVDRLVRLLRRNGVRVFYDSWEQSELWGKDLYQHLDTIYRSAAQYCLIFVSEHYITKAWTKHELRSAQARAFEQNSEYILPIRLDDSTLPGLPLTVAYLDIRTKSLSEICQALVSKLGFSPKPDVHMLLYSTDWEDREKALVEIALSGSAEHFERVSELMLSDPMDEVRERAAWALDNLNDERSLSALINAIHDRRFGVRSAAGWALVHLGEKLVRPEMERVYRDSKSSGAREMAILVLQNL